MVRRGSEPVNIVTARLCRPVPRSRTPETAETASSAKEGVKSGVVGAAWVLRWPWVVLSTHPHLGVHDVFISIANDSHHRCLGGDS
ncbi:MAG: hypothetical protein ACI9MR_002446 [Myxococcota bacterium]|jgi:hypothetical protein